MKNKIKEDTIKILAKAKYIHISPKKIRLVIDVIRGMDVDEAKDQLKFIQKRACQSILKLLNSAIANAKHNFDLKKENLYIKEITVNQGPTNDRWMPRAFGRAAPIRKRTSHITIILNGKNINTLDKKNKNNNNEDKKNTAIQLETVKDKKTFTKDVSLMKKSGEKKGVNMRSKGNFKKKIFNRKSV